MISAAATIHPRNAVTYLGLLLGFAATLAALDDRPSAAVAAIALAAVADTFDGRFARLFSSTPAREAVGGQLDSLSDACTFGLAPVLCVVAAAPAGPSLFIAAAAFAYLAATVTRLAFFNVTSESTPGFIGLPAPVAALCLATTLTVAPDPEAILTVMIASAIGMVGPWRIPRPSGAGLIAFACWPVALVLTLALRS